MTHPEDQTSFSLCTPPRQEDSFLPISSQVKSRSHVEKIRSRQTKCRAYSQVLLRNGFASPETMKLNHDDSPILRTDKIFSTSLSTMNEFVLAYPKNEKTNVLLQRQYNPFGRSCIQNLNFGRTNYENSPRDQFDPSFYRSVSFQQDPTLKRNKYTRGRSKSFSELIEAESRTDSSVKGRADVHKTKNSSPSGDVKTFSTPNALDPFPEDYLGNSWEKNNISFSFPNHSLGALDSITETLRPVASNSLSRDNPRRGSVRVGKIRVLPKSFFLGISKNNAERHGTDIGKEINRIKKNKNTARSTPLANDIFHGEYWTPIHGYSEVPHHPRCQNLERKPSLPQLNPAGNSSGRIFAEDLLKISPCNGVLFQNCSSSQECERHDIYTKMSSASVPDVPSSIQPQNKNLFEKIREKKENSSAFWTMKLEKKSKAELFSESDLLLPRCLHTKYSIGDIAFKDLCCSQGCDRNDIETKVSLNFVRDTTNSMKPEKPCSLKKYEVKKRKNLQRCLNITMKKRNKLAEKITQSPHGWGRSFRCTQYPSSQ